MDVKLYMILLKSNRNIFNLFLIVITAFWLQFQGEILRMIHGEKQWNSNYFKSNSTESEFVEACHMESLQAQ